MRSNAGGNMTIETSPETRGSVRDLPAGVEIHAACTAGQAAILSRAALEFVADLERQFRATREALMGYRTEV